MGIFVAGCATPYQKIGTDSTGGHMYRRLGKDTFTVSFLANGFTAPKRAVDFALLRAAEVTLEHGFLCFTIIGEEDLSSRETFQSGGTAYTTGTAKSYGGYTTYSGTTTYTPTETSVYKPGSEIAIHCFTDVPGDHAGMVYFAEKVKTELRTKYLIKESEK